MGTLPALVGFQVPNMNLGETFTSMAKLAAYDQARRASALELEEKRAQRDRDAQVRQLLAASLQPQPQGPGQGFASAQPQAGPPAAAPPQEPTMPPLGVPVPVNTQTGVWGQPGGFTAAQPPEIAAMAPPVDTSQPPLQGGGFTQAPVGTPAQTTVGAAAAQPAAPAPQPVSLTTAQPGAPTPQTGFAAPQPTRPLSASVPGVLPLPDPEKIQQAMLLNPQMTSQWYGAHLTQRGKQLDEVKRNNQLVYQYGKAIQANPEFYQQALKELEELGVPVPKNMPPTYNAALIQFHIDKSRDIDTAVKEQQLENQKAQAQLHQAQAKDVPLRTQLESQRLGLQGTTATMNDELRAMNKNPLTATAEDRQEAQRRIQQRELAKEGEAQRLKFEQEQKQQATLPLQDARKDDAGLFVYAGTGKGVEGTKPYGEVKTLQEEKDPDKRIVKLGNLDEKKQLTNLKQLEPVLQQYSALIQYAYGPGGPLEHHTRGPISFVGAAFRQALQTDPKLEGMRRSLMGQLQSLVRGLGARGDLNEQELKAATEMIANFDASGGLGLSLGPMAGTGGIGIGASIKPSLSIPDTPQVGLELANNLIDTVNKRIGSLVQHEGYAKTPQITLPKPGTSPEATVSPRTWGYAQPATPGQPTPAPPAPPMSTPPPTFGPGDPTQQLRPQTPPGRQSQAQPAGAPRVASWWGSPPQVMSERDVQEAMRQTGRSREEVMQAARARRYTLTA